MKVSLKIFSFFLFLSTLFPQQLIWNHTDGPMGGIVGDIAINSQGEIYTGVYGSMGTSFQFKYYSGLYKSTNNGDTWNEITTQFDPFEVYALYITTDNHILVGTNHQGRIYRSTDNGQTWENNNSGYNSGECWAFGESKDGIIFAGSGEGELYRSTNNGDSWEFSANLASLGFATDSNNVVYCCTLFGLYKTADNGLTWQPDSSLINMEVSSILIDTNNNIYCSTGYYNISSGVYYSKNGGESWTYLGLEGKIVLSLALDSEENLYAGTRHNGLFKTRDLGKTWIQYQDGIYRIEVFRLKINKQNHIIIGSENEGVFSSENGGESFKQIGLPISHIQNIDFSPDNCLIFASTPTGVQKYDRTTGIWENKGLMYVEAVSVSPSGDLYAATFKDGIYLSTDDGENWRKITTGADSSIERYNFKAIKDSVLIDATFGNFKISTDRGNSWITTNIGPGPDRNSILNNDNTNLVYIHGSRNFESKIFYSSDFGQTFFEIAIPAPLSSKNGIALNSINDLFFSTALTNNQVQGIYRSSYSYTNWSKLYTGTTYCVFIDSNDIVYAAIEDGILRSTNNGDNWNYIFTENMPRTFAHDLKTKEGNLYIATNSYGLYELQIPTSVNEENVIVKAYQLYQNYPNPFNPITTIKYSIPRSENVQINIYNVLGKGIKTIINEYKPAGIYKIDFDGSVLPSGVYFYRIISGNYSETKKMILLR